MGKMTLTPKQQIIFDEVKNSDFLKQNFYFTGGTALSSVYLSHRLSEDLDFFSQEKFDVLPILNLINEWGVKYTFKKDFVDPYLIAVDCLKVKSFENLPQMLVPLELKNLQNFYKDLAKKLGMSVVEK